MSTSTEIKEARYFKEYLTQLRKEETSLVKKLENVEIDFKEYLGDEPDALVTLKRGLNKGISDVRAAIEKTKAILATKVHINTKAENRKARQAAAKGRTGGKSKSR